MAALTLNLTDVTGVTDANQKRAVAAVITDSLSITDAGTQKGYGGTANDAVGLSDAGASSVVDDVYTDSAGLTDPVTRSGDASGPNAYTLAVTDRVFNQSTADDLAVVGGSPVVPPAEVVRVITGLPRLRVEIAFNLPTSADPTAFILDDPVNGMLDAGYHLADGLVWEDVSHYLKTYDLRRGSSRVAGPVVRYEAGELTITLNNDDRRFDPTNMTGPYVASNGITQVRPMRPIRVTALWQGSEYPRFYGFVDSWLDDGTSPVTSTTTVTATDAFKVLANDRGDVAAGATVFGTGEKTGARVGRILDSIGWPANKRQIADGTVTLQGTTLAGDALAELQLVAETEGGDLFVDPEGNVVFTSRLAYSTEPASATSQAIFGRYGDGYPGELPYSDVGREYDDTTLINQAVITRAGGTPRTVTDSASVSEFMLHSYASDGLLFTSDDDAQVLASLIVATNRLPEFRFTELILDPRADPGSLFPQALGRRFRDRITVRRRPPGGGLVERDVFVVGLSESQNESKQWATAFALQGISAYQGGTGGAAPGGGSTGGGGGTAVFLKLDDTTNGYLDLNVLSP